MRSSPSASYANTRRRERKTRRNTRTFCVPPSLPSSVPASVIPARVLPPYPRSPSLVCTYFLLPSFPSSLPPHPSQLTCPQLTGSRLPPPRRTRTQPISITINSHCLTTQLPVPSLISHFPLDLHHRTQRRSPPPLIQCFMCVKLGTKLGALGSKRTRSQTPRRINLNAHSAESSLFDTAILLKNTAALENLARISTEGYASISPADATRSAPLPMRIRVRHFVPTSFGGPASSLPAHASLPPTRRTGTQPIAITINSLFPPHPSQTDSSSTRPSSTRPSPTHPSPTHPLSPTLPPVAPAHNQSQSQSTVAFLPTSFISHFLLDLHRRTHARTHAPPHMRLVRVKLAIEPPERGLKCQ